MESVNKLISPYKLHELRQKNKTKARASMADACLTFDRAGHSLNPASSPTARNSEFFLSTHTPYDTFVRDAPDNL
jgi:hypothetical protein